MAQPRNVAAPDVFRDIIGLDLPPERLAEVLRLYAAILGEIQKLRTLDLGELHPAVIFDPAAGYERETPP